MLYNEVKVAYVQNRQDVICMHDGLSQVISCSHHNVLIMNETKRKHWVKKRKVKIPTR